MKQFLVILLIPMLFGCETSPSEPSGVAISQSSGTCVTERIDVVTERLKTFMIDLSHKTVTGPSLKFFLDNFNSTPPKTRFQADRLDYFVSGSTPHITGVILSNSGCYVGEASYPTILFQRILLHGLSRSPEA